MISDFDWAASMDDYTLEDLLKKVPNKYLLTLLVAQKAKYLNKVYNKIEEVTKREAQKLMAEKTSPFTTPEDYKEAEEKIRAEVLYAVKAAGLPEDKTKLLDFVLDKVYNGEYDFSFLREQIDAMEELQELFEDMPAKLPSSEMLVDFSLFVGVAGAEEDLEELELEEEVEEETEEEEETISEEDIDEEE